MHIFSLNRFSLARKMGRNARAETHVHICTALIVLSTFIVAIRIVARWKKSILGWDDYAISLSLAIAYSMLGEAIICTFLGQSQVH